jgi:hypothetical protein
MTEVVTATPSYQEIVASLGEGLQAIERTLVDLSEDEWRRPTLLKPLDPESRPWNVLELAAHCDISIGLALTLVAQPEHGQVGRDRVSFFIFDRNQVAPVVYDYAIERAKGHNPETMLALVHDTFEKTLEAARTTPPDTVGSGYYALMRLDDFVASRIVEAVVHGMDLTDAVNRPPLDTPKATAQTASILDELLARRTVAGRPADLRSDDLAFIRAASGRGDHPDPRFPLLG